ncbi:uncharacterized protein LOC129762845 [Toxorhynchites rutilus septentrionalis]|uniref:uncharacterized protein LOC129762845 n=1 Tax=Toxorhynchites rutilus septentrionalis TaxID=329112 RepID=UPI00247903BC|nr:uncharacterized protein LOC129762845 [Toxorhynchites rutilus septentrionalis]
MALKSDLIWDKMNERLALVDRGKRSFKIILFVHLLKNEELAKSVVLDFDKLKIAEIELGAMSNDEYPTERIDGSLTIDDNDFYSVITKQTTFAAIIEQGSAKITGEKEIFIKLDEKFRTQK